MICPLCGQGELVRRRGRGRSIFYGCERYPDCTFTAREPIRRRARRSFFPRSVRGIAGRPTTGAMAQSSGPAPRALTADDYSGLINTVTAVGQVTAGRDHDGDDGCAHGRQRTRGAAVAPETVPPAAVWIDWRSVPNWVVSVLRRLSNALA